MWYFLSLYLSVFEGSPSAICCGTWEAAGECSGAGIVVYFGIVVSSHSKVAARHHCRAGRAVFPEHSLSAQALTCKELVNSQFLQDQLSAKAASLSKLVLSYVQIVLPFWKGGEVEPFWVNPWSFFDSFCATSFAFLWESEMNIWEHFTSVSSVVSKNWEIKFLRGEKWEEWQFLRSTQPQFGRML